MKDHIIMCGFGFNGQKVAEELKKKGIDYVVIEKNKEVVSSFYGASSKVQYIGNATLDGASRKILVDDAKSEDVLKQAGIEEAKAVLITVESDAEAAFISLMARKLNHSIPIVVKAARLESMKRIYQAGASKVISPSVIGGEMAARAAIKPLVADFVDRITFMKDYDIARVEVGTNSGFSGKKIKDLKLPRREISILAIHHMGELITNPGADMKLEEGDMMVVLGPSRELQAIARG